MPNAFRRDSRLRRNAASFVLSVLVHLARHRHNGAVRPRLIATWLMVSKSTIYRALWRLRKLGLIGADGWPVADVEALLEPAARDVAGFQRVYANEVRELGSFKLAHDWRCVRGIDALKSVERDRGQLVTPLRLAATMISTCTKTSSRRLHQLAAKKVLLLVRDRGQHMRVRLLTERERKTARARAAREVAKKAIPPVTPEIEAGHVPDLNEIFAQVATYRGRPP